MIHKKDELWFIVYGRFKMPLEDNVYTDCGEAEAICAQKNLEREPETEAFEVMSVDEYIDYMYERGASAAAFE